MRKEKLWTGSPPERCDVCETEIGSVFYDAATRYRVWAILCEPCFERVGVGLGLGYGQRYEMDDGGRFVKTAG